MRRPAPRRTDAATVVILDRPATRTQSAAQAVPAAPAAAGPSIATSQLPTVQFVERPRSPAAAAAFTVEQMMLIGFLLDRYRENTMAINDAPNTAVAEGALAVLGVLLQAAGAPVAPEPASASPADAAPVAPAPPSRADAANEPHAGARSRASAKGRARRADARGGEGTANVDPPNAASAPAEPTSSGSDIPSSPATPTGERERA